MSTVGSVPHRLMRGIKCRLEQLMTHRGLQSVSNSYEVHETVLPHVSIKGVNGYNSYEIKTPPFLLD